MRVEYRDVDGFPGYRVGDDGSVWTCKNARWGFKDQWRELRFMVATTGYRYVMLSRRNPAKTQHFYVHALVLTSFRSQRPAGYDACHENGDRLDNRIENLRWDTRANNMADAKWHGTLGVSRKLSESDVLNIRFLRTEGAALKAIARRYNVSVPLVCMICLGSRRRALAASSRGERAV